MNSFTCGTLMCRFCYIHMKNFWQKLKKGADKGEPILALAPMAGLTDSAFRQICKKFGADVVYSEMASVNALCYVSKKTLEMLKFDKKERPYVVQLFGSQPENFAKAVKIIEKKIPARLPAGQAGRGGGKPDGIDINFGCPVKKVLKQGAGACLMKDLKLSRQIIKSVLANTKLPVSIKVRAKVGDMDVLKFLKNIQDLNVSAIMIHGRSLSQGFSGDVDWKIIKQARKYFNGAILANGGVMNAEDGKKLLEQTQADGIGIARGALGQPWIFSQLVTHNSQLINKKYIFKLMLEHANLVYKLKGKRGVIEMRQHLAWYVRGLKDAKKLRAKLVQVESLKDIIKVISDQT